MWDGNGVGIPWDVVGMACGMVRDGVWGGVWGGVLGW